MLVWLSYQSDLGRVYPVIGVNLRPLTEIETEADIFNLIGNTNLGDLDNPCEVPDLIYRTIKLYLSDDSIYQVVYPQPFNADLFDRLSTSLSVTAFEFIGEKIKYSRLKRMLNFGA